MPAPDPAPTLPPSSRQPTMSVIPSEWNESRDLQLSAAASLEGITLPWSSLHEGIPVLWETTFAFQRAKPIVVSPFENPFPTRGRGPWTPWGAAGSRWFLRIPSTGRAPPTASCSVLRYSFVIVLPFENKPKCHPPNSSDSSMEIPPIAAARLRRDDRQGRPSGFRGKGRARVRRWDSGVAKVLVCTQKAIRCQ